MYKKQWIASNIKALVDSGRADSISGLAVRAGLTKPTLTTFIKEPELRNISIDKLIAIAHVLRVDPWVLMLPDFPIDCIGQGKTLSTISHEGYRLLSVFEGLADDKRKAILDYVLYQLKEEEATKAKQIRDARAQYKARPSAYPQCDEDFE